MDRRQFVNVCCSTFLLTSAGGCLSQQRSPSYESEISEIEVWNSDDSKHTFHVDVFDSNANRTFEQTVILAASSENHFTREVLTEAPSTAATIRAEVDDKTDEKDVTGFDRPVQISIKYNSDHQLEIVD